MSVRASADECGPSQGRHALHINRTEERKKERNIIEPRPPVPTSLEAYCAASNVNANVGGRGEGAAVVILRLEQDDV